MKEYLTKTAENKLSLIENQLPPEIILQILSYLKKGDLSNLARASTKWHELIQSNYTLYGRFSRFTDWYAKQQRSFEKTAIDLQQKEKNIFKPSVINNFKEFKIPSVIAIGLLFSGLLVNALNSDEPVKAITNVFYAFLAISLILTSQIASQLNNHATLIKNNGSNQLKLNSFEENTQHYLRHQISFWNTQNRNTKIPLDASISRENDDEYALKIKYL